MPPSYPTAHRLPQIFFRAFRQVKLPISSSQFSTSVTSVSNARPPDTAAGLPGPSEQKCQTTCKKMPTRFIKRQTSRNRLNAIGFDITRRVIWQKHSDAREQGANYTI